MILYGQLQDMELSLRGARIDVWIDHSVQAIALADAETLDARLKRIKSYAVAAFSELWIPDSERQS
jgi:hypothetical protein